MFSFNSQITKLKNKANTTEYTIQITTDNYEQYKFMQDVARECVDGKHKESILSMAEWITAYKDSDTVSNMPNIGDTTIIGTDSYISNYCKNCPQHPSNGGTGICNCTLGGQVTFTTSTTTKP